MPDPSAMFSGALDALVSDGTITSAQETAITEALSSAMQQGGPGGQQGATQTGDHELHQRRQLHADLLSARGPGDDDFVIARPSAAASGGRAVGRRRPPASALDQLDRVAVRVVDERQPRAVALQQIRLRVTRPPNSSSTGSTASMSSVSKAKWPNRSPPG